MKTFAAFILIAFFFCSCSTGPEAISFGKDICQHCKMTIMDQKFGAEIVTAKGKVLKFDSVECLRDYFASEYKNSAGETDQYFTIDFASPGKFIDAKNAFYLYDQEIKSPMGGNLAAFKSQQALQQQSSHPDATVLSWNVLLKKN